MRDDRHFHLRRSTAALIALGLVVLGFFSYPALRALRNVVLQVIETRTGPTPIAKPTFTEPPFVLLVLGQSNAANHAAVRTEAPGHFAFAHGRFYPLADPLPGCTGAGGSAWPSFAQALAAGWAGATTRRVVVACLAVTGSSVSEWAPERNYLEQVAATVSQLADAGLAVSAVVWHQGETDAVNRTSAADYEAALTVTLSRVHALAPPAPIFVCLASRPAQDQPASAAVRAAQQAVIERLAFVHAGVDTDLFAESLRSDGVHFNLQGAELLGRLLAQAVRQPRDVPPAWPRLP